MIYKKTQVPCPLPYYMNAYNLSHNASDAMGLYQMPGNFSHMADVSPAVAGGSAVHFEPHADAEDMCTPKYFVFNSQVRRRGRNLQGLEGKSWRSRGDAPCVYYSVARLTRRVFRTVLLSGSRLQLLPD